MFNDKKYTKMSTKMIQVSELQALIESSVAYLKDAKITQVELTKDGGAGYRITREASHGLLAPEHGVIVWVYASEFGRLLADVKLTQEQLQEFVAEERFMADLDKRRAADLN